MNKVCIDSWEQFDGELSKLNAYREEMEKNSSGYVSDFLFRGQSNSEWKIETTLERLLGKRVPLLRYYEYISSAKKEIESITSKEWDLPSFDQYMGYLSKGNAGTMGEFPGYEYMVYLRHHGFPSPLLDWTISPYIAAYFAFRNAKKTNKAVSIYAYLEHVGGGKARWGNEAFIRSLGSNIRTHPRHYLQKSQYTICTTKEDDRPVYCSHEEAFTKEKRSQDLVWKLILPTTERTDFLTRLDLHNTNSYSLFGTEESLIETIAFRKMLIKK